MANKNKQKWTERTEHNIDGWFSPDDMATLQGTILDGKVIRNQEDEERLIWIVELTEPCMLHAPGEADGKEFPAGSIAGMGHRAKLKPILDHYLRYTDFEVRVSPTEKIKLRGGRTMWLFRVATSGGKAREASIQLEAPSPSRMLPAAKSVDRQPVEDADFEEDNLPF